MIEKKIKENGEHFCILVCYFFYAKLNRSTCRCRSGWENLDRGQYRFQPIKFVNSVVPSPCETQPYNNSIIITITIAITIITIAIVIIIIIIIIITTIFF